VQRILTAATWLGVLAMLGGIGTLLAYASSEMLADPSLSLEDAYWIGRLPWTAVGVGLAVAGSTLAVVTGTAAVLIHGGNVRRVIALAMLLPAAFWWAIELLQMQGVSGACGSLSPCTRPWIDPITNAYSMPAATLLLLLVPALIVAGLALVPRRIGAATVMR
jgi:hypothetical protein